MPSSTPINCLRGMTYTNVPSSGGVCGCTCGAMPETAEMFIAANTAACSKSGCTSNFPSSCPSSGRIAQPTYTTLASYFLRASVSVTSVAMGAGSICFAYSYSYGSGVITNVQGGWNAADEYSSVSGLCTAEVARVFARNATFILEHDYVLCNTNNCNSVSASVSASASPRITSPAAGLFFAAAALAAFL